MSRTRSGRAHECGAQTRIEVSLLLTINPFSSVNLLILINPEAISKDCLVPHVIRRRRFIIWDNDQEPKLLSRWLLRDDHILELKTHLKISLRHVETVLAVRNRGLERSIWRTLQDLHKRCFTFSRCGNLSPLYTSKEVAQLPQQSIKQVAQDLVPITTPNSTTLPGADELNSSLLKPTACYFTWIHHPNTC